MINDREEESDLRFISPSIRELVKAENQISFIQLQARAREREAASGLHFLDYREEENILQLAEDVELQTKVNFGPGLDVYRLMKLLRGMHVRAVRLEEELSYQKIWFRKKLELP